MIKSFFFLDDLSVFRFNDLYNIFTVKWESYTFHLIETDYYHKGPPRNDLGKILNLLCKVS